ncbi:PREDICTED: cytochrome b5 isoform X1 [Rhagoletis zephyria]|uniref:cytochrome b5 isoform X1 n=1 Tax=Rhagoletis zephyria TaxID=28612 RepID=UPI000811517F|nr:PREDICTED: cytochrome b5 isoform X1 [Rhagoletis zephyria]
MAAPKTYNLEAVKQHNTPDDLWIVIEGKVYDVTKFRNEHPGGEETLDEVAGRDATRDFLDVGHSQEARQILKKYYIGDLEASDWTSKLPVSTPSVSPTTPTPPSQSAIITPVATATPTVGKEVVAPPEKQCCTLA